MAMSKTEVAEAVSKKSRKGRISCRVALKLANDLDVSPKRIGTACNDLKIKIAGCQLGCF
jgi:hypothetical protein